MGVCKTSRSGKSMGVKKSSGKRKSVGVALYAEEQGW